MNTRKKLYQLNKINQTLVILKVVAVVLSRSQQFKFLCRFLVVFAALVLLNIPVCCTSLTGFAFGAVAIATIWTQINYIRGRYAAAA